MRLSTFMYRLPRKDFQIQNSRRTFFVVACSSNNNACCQDHLKVVAVRRLYGDSKSSRLFSRPASQLSSTVVHFIDLLRSPHYGKTETELKMPSKTQVWCEGSLLHAVQMSGLYPDCKTFVDMPLKYDAEEIIAKWDALQSLGDSTVTNDVLAAFLRENFGEPEGELVECAPEDWQPMTDKFADIVDEDYRKFAAALHGKWPTLYRKIADKVLMHPDRYSIIPVPNPFIVPGGRFREMYYWDSFFTIKGLIASGMLNTVKGMIENMLFLVETCGFIPNGNRVYYLNRSQPPLLTWCVQAYYEATKDAEFLAAVLPTLRKELAFFQANKSIMLEGWAAPLFRFTVQSVRPRPESYREDLESAEHLDDIYEKCVLWGDLAAAAESGRDFSARWFAVHGPNAGKLSGTRTSQIIPVELNAIICGNIRMMGEMYDVIGDVENSKWCANMRDGMIETIHQVLWNEEQNVWFDFDLEQMTQLKTFNDTNFWPMFTLSAHEGFDANKIADYLHSSGALGFKGGLPSSLVNSGEQWDFPNSWAPNTWVLVEGLRAYGQDELAESIAAKWVQKNFNMWSNSGGIMFEKYNVVSACYKVKGGGEYTMQEGFGWTNGVILDFMRTYGKSIRWTEADSCECCDVNLHRKLHHENHSTGQTLGASLGAMSLTSDSIGGSTTSSMSPVSSGATTPRFFASSSSEALKNTPSVVSLQSLASTTSGAEMTTVPPSPSPSTSSTSKNILIPEITIF